MGARVEGTGSNLITVHGRFGKDDLGGATLAISPDHIEAASVAAIAALSGGRLTIEGTRRRDLRLIARVYDRLGLHISLDEDAVVVPVHERFEAPSRDEDVDVTVELSPWPGFPSDLIAMATVIATQARGTTLIHEKLFNNRMLFTDRLTAMGAQIVLCDPHRAIVVGPTRLQRRLRGQSRRAHRAGDAGGGAVRAGRNDHRHRRSLRPQLRGRARQTGGGGRAHPPRGIVSEGGMAITLKALDGLEYAAEVTGDGAPVLLLHGWGGRIESMQAVAAGLIPHGFQAHILDLPGFGRSDVPPQAPEPWGVFDYTQLRAPLPGDNRRAALSRDRPLVRRADQHRAGRKSPRPYRQDRAGRQRRGAHAAIRPLAAGRSGQRRAQAARPERA